MKKRLLAALLALCMVTAMLPETAFAAGTFSGENVIEKSEDSMVFTLETSAKPPVLPVSIDQDGNVALKEGAYEKWIDRIDIPEYARNFYDILIEASDNDGDRDYLIDDEYFNTSATSNDYKDLSVGDIYYDSKNSKTAIIVAIISCEYDAEWAAAKAAYDEAAKYIGAVYNAFNRDHNEVFWLSDRFSYGYSASRTDAETATVWVYFYLKYDSQGINLRTNNFNAAEIKDQIDTMNNNVDAILADVPEGANRYETLAYFNKWLTENNEYNTDLNNGPWDMHKATNALAGKTGEAGPVCEGYARALKVLCDRENIPCTLVDGYAKSSGTGGEAHMWNYVQMEDGKWYAVDVTWDDPTGEPSGAKSGYETDRWLLLGENTLVSTGLSFIESHPVENRVSNQGVSFTNGPELNPTAYVELTYSGMPENLEVNDEIKLMAARTPMRKSDVNTYTYGVSSGTLPNTLTIDANTGAISGTFTEAIGGTTVTVSLYENGTDAGNCDIVFPAVDETDKLENTVTFTNPAEVFYKDGDSNPEISFNATHSGTVGIVYEYKERNADDSAYTTTPPTAVGQYTVRAKVTGDPTYKDASATHEFKIMGRIDVSGLAWSTLDSFSYDGSEHSVTLTNVPETVQVTYRNNAETYAGNYTASVAVTPVDMDYYEIRGTVPNKSWSITAVDQNPTVTDGSLRIGGNKMDLTTLVTGAQGDVSFTLANNGNTGSTFDGNSTLTSGNTAGEVTVNVNIAAKSVNEDTVPEYNAWTGTVKISVLDKELKALTVTQSNVTYGDTLPDPAYTPAASAGAEVTITYTGRNGTSYDKPTAKPADSGDYTVTVSYETADARYTGTADFTIAKRDISGANITLSGNSLIYDGTSKQPVIQSVTVGNLTLTTNDYTVTSAPQTDAGENYELTSPQREIPIIPVRQAQSSVLRQSRLRLAA